MNRPGMSPGLRLSLAYVVIAAVWIIASDRLVTLLVTDPDVRDVVQSIKGLFYILLTASLLYLFARREFKHSEAANRALAESEAKWRSLVENAPDFILTIDRAGNILFINHTSEDQRLTNAVHRQVYQYIAPDYHDTVRQAIERVFETGQPTAQELAALGPGGSRTWYSCMLGPITHNGEVASVLMIARDVTSRKETETALQRELSVGQALTALYSPLVSPYSSIEQIADTVYQQARQITASEHGFVSAIDPTTGDNVGYTLSAMFEEFCSISADHQKRAFSPNADGTYPGLWGYSLTTGEAFFTNAPATHPASRGVPEGHVPLQRFLSVPVFLGGELVGQIALANAPGDYDGHDLDAIQRLAGVYALAIQRKRAESALYEASETLEALIQASPLPIFVLDLAGNVQVIWNQAAERVFGWRADEVMGHPLPIVSPENQGQFRSFIERILGGESLVGVETTRHRRDGTPVEVSISTAPLRDAEGTITGIMSVVADITERKRMERAEREQRALAKALADIATTLNKTLDLNEVLDHILGSIGRVVPHDIANIMLIEQEQVSVVRHKGYTERGAAQWIESQRFRVEDFDTFRSMVETGEPVVVPDIADSAAWRGHDELPWRRSYVGAPIRLRGEVIGFLNVASETPGFYSAEQAQRLQAFADHAAVALENARLYDEIRRHADELETRVRERTAELNHSKERIEAILNSSSDVIMLVRRDGTVEQVNTTFDRVFLCGPEEVLDQHLTDLVHPDDADRLAAALATVVEARQPHRLEMTMYCQQRAMFDADMILSPILEYDGRLLGVVCSVRDITTRKHMEVKLKQMLEREMELGELKSRYVSMAAHDLRTPLAVIKSSADLLAGYAGQMSDVQRETTFERLRAGITQMVELLDDILTIGRVEAGKIRFEPEWVNLEAFCGDIVREFEQLPALEHTIEFASTGDCVEVYLDPKLVRYVLNNLLSNAIKYSPPGTAVTFDLACAQREVVLQVRDQGIGIPSDDQPHIFEAFHRAHNVGSTPGTGLGLAIVKQSVDLHGGSIAFESEEGAVTTFTVTLPCARRGE